MAKKHITQKQLDKLHKPVNETEHGACLTGHEGRYKEDKSCSYRWQAHYVSIKERTSVYNGITLQDGQKTRNGIAIRNIAGKGVQTSAYKTKKGRLHPSSYVSHLPPPGPGDWDLKGPPKELAARKTIGGRKEKVPAHKNFTKDRWPYWHNAHHLIPKSLLNEAIDEAGKDSPNQDAASIIRKSLLEVEHNVNHFINMVILPQDREVGRLLKMPRHLILIELSGLQSQLKRSETACHEAYDRYVKVRLQKIINELADKVHHKNCESPETAGICKDKLIQLSKDLYQEIRTFGESHYGEPIADMEKKGQPTPSTPPAAKPAPVKKTFGAKGKT